MPLTGWTETRYYDPFLDEEGVTITGYSGHGAYWIRQVMAPPGKSRRAQREAALDLIEVAIDTGQEPGEVKPI